MDSRTDASAERRKKGETSDRFEHQSEQSESRPFTADGDTRGVVRRSSLVEVERVRPTSSNAATGVLFRQPRTRF